MPNRILKESICTSDSIDRLSLFNEVFFYRLIVNCDDYGRMDARPRILLSRLFPLREVAFGDIVSAIVALSDAGLITTYNVDGKPYLQMKTWDKHQQVRAKKSKYPSPDDSACNQVIADDYKCPRNPIQSLSESESLSLSEGMLEDDEAHAIQSEQNKVLDAAEDAGFKMSNNVRAALIALYAENGLEKMLEGMKSCSEHGAPNIAYLRACLRGKPKQAKAKVVAQDYEQRDYSDVDKQVMDAQNRRMKEYMEKKVGGG